MSGLVCRAARFVRSYRTYLLRERQRQLGVTLVYPYAFMIPASFMVADYYDTNARVSSSDEMGPSVDADGH